MSDLSLSTPAASGNIFEAPGAAKGLKPDDFADVSRRVLQECVRAITGRDDIPPRIGQARLLDDIVSGYTRTYSTSQEIGGQVVGEAPTGTGKSFAYLTPALVAKALLNQRTVVSTEMISLQTQLIDKDAPVVADAVEKITGYRPLVALLKGWSNYACTASAVETASETFGIESSRSGQALLEDLREKVSKRLEAVSPKRRADGTLDFKAMIAAAQAADSAGAAVSAEDRELLAVLRWVLDEAASLGEKRPDGTGDKNAYEGDLTDPRTWESVSVSSSDCVGAAKCAFADSCLPGKARAKAAEADVVITNHHLLAVQAAKGVPVVIGSKTLGNFQHIVVDEAHGLPTIVRGQGSVEVSSRTIKRASRMLTRIFDESDTNVSRVMKEADGIADRLDMELEEWAAKIKRNEEVFRLTAADDPVNDTTLLIGRWTKSARELVTVAEKSSSNPGVQMKARRIKNALDALDDSVRLVSTHEPGCARWVEVVRPHPKATNQKAYPAARYTPVDVSPMLKFNLWTAEDVEALAEQVDAHEGDGPVPRLDLTVAALSATLPKGFAAQVGLRAAMQHYESPFDDAYGASALFVPRALPGSDDVEALRRPYPGQPKFDTAKHTDWAVQHVLSLVEANGGSALVLAATATAGRVYAERLNAAARGRWNVLSQWDGPPLRKQVADWKADKHAVLVGTKSLMTGVDASGETCTLVIVDRPARARSNPVDDARVEGIMERAGLDKWAADRLVYVADAGMLLEQAAGRLIRSIDDSGMVAVLDPRLLKTSPFSYAGPTRNDYLECLARFETRIADPAKAVDWLRNRREGQGKVA